MQVCVLLSTYNGERYLQEQIASVHAQEGVKVCLIVRDDGSTDSTAELLSRFQNEHQLKPNSPCPAKTNFSAKFCASGH